MYQLIVATEDSSNFTQLMSPVGSEYENQRDCRRAKLEMVWFEIEYDESFLVGPTTQEEIDLIRRLPEKTVYRAYYLPRTLTTVNFLEDRAGLVFETDPEGFEDEGLGRMGDGLMKPPMSNKKFLISPPGSPPVGWEQVVEDVPNQNTLAEDLSQQL
ncbi:Calcipressin-domain-containing protein [Phakopsora pachyrhizi]|nr:Calcipressin-domain-containing protein [Phakopsora pachyrhizi]